MKLVHFEPGPVSRSATQAVSGPTRKFVHDRLIQRLARLDVEQLQVAEIVIDAIARGATK